MLSQTETEFLKNPQNFAPKYSRALRYRIRKKAAKLVKSELALIQQSGETMTRNSCATTENCHALKTLQGLNQAALGKMMVRSTGFEPVIASLEGLCPNQLDDDRSGIHS